jgi:hypothetical protein
MTDPIREMKTRAKILHHHLNRCDPSAVVRLRSLPEFRHHSSEELEMAGRKILHRQCLSLIAVEIGFAGWGHAKAVVSGAPGVFDFGTMLYPKRCCGLLNLWYRQYAEAAVGHRTAGGYLLAYRRDLLVVDRSFIHALGLDPDDADWSILGFDWVQPTDLLARARLYGKLIAQAPREVSA